MSTTTSQHLSCPRCNAHVRAGSQWCTLCFGDPRPASTTPAEPVTVPDEPVHVPASSGKHARSAGNAAAPTARAPLTTVDDGQIDRMLAELAAQSAEPLGRFAGRFDTPASKIGLMVGGTVFAGILILLLMAVVGVLL